MFKKLSVVLSILLTSSLITNEVVAQISIAELQAFLENEVANKRTKGIVVGIIDANGKQIISAGKLNDKSTKKPDGNTIFEIASVTKLFTTLALADMAKQNVVSLNEPISTYLPKNVKTPIFKNKEITLLHLASHTSGFPRFPFNQFPNNEVDTYTIDNLYEYISTFQPTVAFGKEFNYSNTGMGLIGHILSLQKKKPFADLVNEIICKKLGMNSTTYKPSKMQKINLASGHLPYGFQTPHYDESEIMEGSGGSYSTVNDLLKFTSLGLGIGSNELSSAMQLTQAKVGSIGIELGYDADILYDYGMGWNIWTKRGKTIYWKDGTSFGFRSFICLDKEQKKGVVILSNSFNPINDIGFHILDSTYQLKPYQYEWSLIDSLKHTIKLQGVEKAVSKYYDLKISGNKNLIFNEEVLDFIAKEFSQQKKYNQAIRLHELNANEYPKSTTPLESLGDLYLEMGNKVKALNYFNRALAIEPANLHYKWVIDQLKK
jgi:serine-type D-Ala-D-Ala carboxypeptidase/endopeptidase